MVDLSQPAGASALTRTRAQTSLALVALNVRNLSPDLQALACIVLICVAAQQLKATPSGVVVTQ